MRKVKESAAVQPAAAYIPVDSDFVLKDNVRRLSRLMRTLLHESFWKDVFIRFFRKISAVVGLALIIVICLRWPIVGPI